MAPDNLVFTTAALSYLEQDKHDALPSILEIWKSNQSTQHQLEDSLSKVLHHAASRGYTTDVQTILDAGVPPLLPLQQDWGDEYTPLMTAAKYGQREMGRLLWERGGLEYKVVYDDPEYQRGPSSLELAAQNGHTELVRDFLTWSPWMEDDLRRALIGAAQNWYDEIVGLLLAVTKSSSRSIQHALAASVIRPAKTDDHLIARQHATVCQLVDAAGEEWDWTVRCQPMILCTVSSRMVGALRALLEKGADPNAPDSHEGRTPLHQYKRSVGGPPETIDPAVLLLQYGASPEIANNEGETPMHTIAIQGDEDDLKLFLDNCRDPDAALRKLSIHGESLLHFAAMGNCVEVVDFLINCGLDINAANNNGWTPLVCALMPSFQRRISDAVKITKLLLQHGARADTVTAENWTPMHSLASWRPGTLATITDAHGYRAEEFVDLTVVPLVKELIEKGAVLGVCTPVLCGKYATPQTVLGTWGVRMQRLAEMERDRKFGRVLDEDTTSHMWALRNGSFLVYEAIMDALVSTPSSDDTIGR